MLFICLTLYLKRKKLQFTFTFTLKKKKYFIQGLNLQVIFYRDITFTQRIYNLHLHLHLQVI